MYDDFYSEAILKKLSKLRKKDSAHYNAVMRKIGSILSSPFHNYKSLHYSLKGAKRVHIGHFVLVFRVDHLRKLIIFDDYSHHDTVYK
jgi:mRNA-degrading endonuclease RelE of RelBE toxin-antitoxin system